ncbi:HATPase c [Cryptosporidium meleagridis]
MRYSQVYSKLLYDKILKLNQLYLNIIKSGVSKIYRKFILFWYRYAKKVFHYGLIPGTYLYTLWKEDEFTLNPIKLARVLI